MSRQKKKKTFKLVINSNITPTILEFFIKVFKMNFKNRTILWIAVLVFGLIIIGTIGFRIMMQNEMELWVI